MTTGYERRDCTGCDATGVVHDPTNADKVFVGPNANQCTRCRGRGYTEHRIMPPEIAAALAAETDRVRAAYDHNDDVTNPVYDWMFS
jgi:hypothetical protein